MAFVADSISQRQRVFCPRGVPGNICGAAGEVSREELYNPFDGHDKDYILNYDSCSFRISITLADYVPLTGFKRRNVKERHQVKIYGIIAALPSSIKP